MCKLIRPTAIILLISFNPLKADLQVREVEGPPTGPSVVILQTEREETGPTSFRYYAPRSGQPMKEDQVVYDPDPTRSDAEIKAESEAHYYYRDRDLGQTFTTGKEGFKLKAITVRLQPVDVKGGDPATAKVSVQFMKVTGEGKVNENGTSEKGQNPAWETYAFSWPHDPNDENVPDRRPVKFYSDDYLEGEVYEHLHLAQGGVVPEGLNTNDYMKWEFSGKDQIEFEAETTYAFLFLFDEPAAENVKRNIPLSNMNVLPGGKRKDVFPGGHMIRRDGSSTVLNEVFIKDLTDPKDVEASIRASSFPVKENGSPDMDARLQIQPGTLGYPDVDTYRDLYFIIVKVIE